MANRWIWTAVLLGLAVATMLLERGILGGLLGSLFIIFALALWVFPGPLSGSNSETTDPTTNRVSRTVLGVGLGLLAAAAAALLLPPQLFSWAIIGVGILLIIYLVMERHRQ
jgi:hypothetical protein